MINDEWVYKYVRRNKTVAVGVELDQIFFSYLIGYFIFTRVVGETQKNVNMNESCSRCLMAVIKMAICVFANRTVLWGWMTLLGNSVAILVYKICENIGVAVT